MLHRMLLAGLWFAVTSLPSGPGIARTLESGGFRYTEDQPPAYVDARELISEWPRKLGQDSDPWRVWQVDSQIDFRKGQYAAYLDYIYEPRSQELLQYAAQFEIQFEPTYEQLVIHRVEIFRDGHWESRFDPAHITLARRESEFESLMYTGKVSALIVLEDVRVHDRIRMQYTIKGSNPIMGDLLGDSLNLSGHAPTARRQIRILSDAPLAHTIIGATIKASEKQVDDHRELHWLGKNLAAVSKNERAPNWTFPLPTLLVSKQRTWSDVVNWALTLYPEPVPLNAELQLKLATLKALPTIDQQIIAALRLVQTDVRYFGMELGASTHRPAEPNEVYQRRFGDCKDKSRLLISLLRQLGLRADPALVSIAHGKSLTQHPPSAAAFDHVIVRVALANRTVWLDPTQTLQGGDLAHLSTLPYGRALIIAPGERELTEVIRPASDRSEVDISESIESGTGDSIVIALSQRSRGDIADVMRRDLASNSSSEISKRWRQLYTKTLGTATEVEAIRVADDMTRNEIEIQAKFRIEQPWQRLDAGHNYLDLHAAALLQFLEPVTEMERTVPMAQAFPMTLKHRIELLPPKGRQLQFGNDKLSLTDKAFDYRREISRKGDVVQVEHLFVSKSDVITDADLPAYARNLRQVFDASSVRAIAGLGEASLQKSRQERMKQLINDLTRED
ncbi:DUF3857 domain-containing transglutaminase family protein [Ahniella affigens]|nr:DUF3857 domain-containing protein [Ahniella affigens]